MKIKGPLRVGELRKQLLKLPDETVVMVRIENDPDVNPGPEGYMAVTHVFYDARDQSLNLE
jgi:hypothetical protein